MSGTTNATKVTITDITPTSWMSPDLRRRMRAAAMGITSIRKIVSACSPA
jgi:hypothetical protein